MQTNPIDMQRNLTGRQTNLTGLTGLLEKPGRERWQEDSLGQRPCAAGR
jgi:hypothetical protein